MKPAPKKLASPKTPHQQQSLATVQARAIVLGEALRGSIGLEPTVSVPGGRDLMLYRIATAPGLELFREEFGDFYVDRCIGINSDRFNKCGEYLVRRERKLVSRRTALRLLLNAIVPDELMDLLPLNLISAAASA